jgi:hypothetical protein
MATVALAETDRRVQAPDIGEQRDDQEESTRTDTDTDSGSS